jgi:hypothetical protein
MLATAAMGIVATGLDHILATATRDDAQRHIDALDALIATMPRFADMLAGERDGTELYYIVAPLMPAGWTPPGGWPDGRALHIDMPRDEAAAILAITNEKYAALAIQCRGDASYAACLRALAAAPPPVNGDADTFVFEGIGAHDAEVVHARMRASLVARERERSAEAALGPIFADYPKRLAALVAHLAALRIHLEVMKTGACPTASQLAAAPWSTLAAPYALGDRLDLRVADGMLEMAPPRWTGSTKRWSVRCP